MNSGSKKEAAKNYEKSLALNANNLNAERMLKKLRPINIKLEQGKCSKSRLSFP
jgi:hypothetical protein